MLGHEDRPEPALPDPTQDRVRPNLRQGGHVISDLRSDQPPHLEHQRLVCVLTRASVSGIRQQHRLVHLKQLKQLVTRATGRGQKRLALR
ncbi:MAG: hypothetical protein ACI8QZ_003200 [Chlamydiales bacterium]